MNSVGGGGGSSLKNITKLPDHEKKANLTDLTMGEKEDIEMNSSSRSKGVKFKGKIIDDYEEEK